MAKKNDYQTVWQWLLEMGPAKAVILINVIGMIILSIAMAVLHWFTRK